MRKKNSHLSRLCRCHLRIFRHWIRSVKAAV